MRISDLQKQIRWWQYQYFEKCIPSSARVYQLDITNIAEGKNGASTNPKQNRMARRSWKLFAWLVNVVINWHALH